MGRSSNRLAELLADKTPEAMYDALYAGRYLSSQAQNSPFEVLNLLKTFIRSSRQRTLMPATLLQRLASALVESGLLNEAGEQLAKQELTDE